MGFDMKSKTLSVHELVDSTPPTPVGEDGCPQGSNGGTVQDDTDLARLGKKSQLQRHFHAFSILGLTAMTMISWNSILTSLSFAYINGGRAGAIYVFLAGWAGETLVVASLAEMASMAPTSAGQYHWVSEFAPASVQKPLSYVAGWLAALTWQTYIATPAFQAAQLCLELAALNNIHFDPTPWQGTLLTLAVCMIVFFFNVWGAKALPFMEGVVLLLLVIGFFAVLVPLWVLSPMVSASEAFGSFSNFGGWASIGAACVIGQISPVGSLTGCDAAAHMSEEVKDASRIVPRMMMGTILLSGVMGFATTVTLSFVIQDVNQQVAQSTAVYPFIDIFNVAVGSKAGTTGMTVVMILLAVFCSVSCMATASRQAWSFARDDGLPFRVWLTKLTTIYGTPLPVNAMIASLGISVVIALLNLGGSEVFDSVYGLGSSAASMTYIVGIGSILWRRLFGDPLPPARWSLGRWGTAINSIALLFLLQFVAVAYFPVFRQVTAATMNWGIAMFGGVAIFSIINYFVWGRKVYHGPVTQLRKVEME